MFNGQKRPLILLILLISIAGLAYFTLIKSPDLIDNHFQSTLKENGFQIKNIEKIEKRFGVIRYHNITLGEEEKSAIELLDIHYKPLLLNKIIALKISGIYLSGDIDINGRATIQGIKNGSISIRALNALPAEISLKNINLSFLSAHFGGIRAKANLTAQREKSSLKWNGNIDSRQDQLEIIAKLSGQMNHTGAWLNDIEIENAKLERNIAKFTRTNGQINLEGNTDQWLRLNANLNAGGFITHNTTWQNANINISATPDEKSLLVTAKSSGIPDLELSIETTLDNNKLENWNASIYAPSGKALLDYLSSNQIIKLEANQLPIVNQQKDINLDLEKANRSLIFNLKKNQQGTIAKGKFQKSNRNTYIATSTSKNDIFKDVQPVTCSQETAPSPAYICKANISYNGKTFTLIN